MPRPSLSHTELARALLVAERRGDVSEAQVVDYLNRLARLPIATDEAAPEHRRAGHVWGRREGVRGGPTAVYW